jgi:cephalosporin-C deacetylase
MRSSLALPFLRFAAFLLLAATSVFAATPLPISVSCDEHTGIYATGQKAVFAIERTDASETAAPVTVNILKNNKDVVFSETIPGTEKSRAITFEPPADGWYYCAVNLPGTEKKPSAATGIVVNPAAYQPSVPTPKDFDAFWDSQRARLAAEKVTPKLAPLTDAQRAIEEQNPDHKKKIEDLERQGYFFSNLEIPCLDVRPTEGYFAKPPKAVKGGHPAILYFHAAGVDGSWCRADLGNALSLSERNNALVLDMNAHGMLNGQPQEYYTALANGDLKNYQKMNRDNRDKFYFVGMFLRLMRAIDFLCAQPEWDGKHLICIGISQGGAQTLAAAGLDPRVSATVTIVPGLCDLTGPLVDRPSGWPGIGSTDLSDESTRKYLEIAPYFDAVNFCVRSKAESLFTVGFVDTTCPAPGVFTAYNQLKSAKRIITAPDKGHRELSSPTPEQSAQYNAFVLAHCKN